MLNPLDAWRRWFGLLFLVIAVGILIWGQTVFKEYLAQHHRAFVFYWLTCFVFTDLAILTALLDFYIIRRRGKREQRELFEKSFMEEQSKPPRE